MSSEVDARTHPIVRVLRLAFAVLGATALTWIPLHSGEGFGWANYFGYFTVLSNVLAVVVLAVGAIRDPQEPRWQWCRGGVTVYMVVTGIVYAALLADVDVGMQGQWTNDVMHRILPVVLLLDWVLCPPRPAIRTGVALAWVWFPLAYGAYTLARGPIVDWYPYPFIDPREQGYPRTVIGLVVLVIVFALISVLVNVAGRLARAWRYGERTNEREVQE